MSSGYHVLSAGLALRVGYVVVLVGILSASLALRVGYVVVVLRVGYVVLDGVLSASLALRVVNVVLNGVLSDSLVVGYVVVLDGVLNVGRKVFCFSCTMFDPVWVIVQTDSPHE